MDYASALLKGRGPSAPVAASPKPIARPNPAPIAPPKQAAAAPRAAVAAIDPVEAAGIFGRLPVAVAVKIAAAAGPQGACNLGVSCRYLYEKVLNAAWKLVQEQSSKTKKPIIKVRLDLAGTSADVEDEGEDAAEIKVDGKVLSLPLSQFARDTQRVKLVSYWLDIVTQAQNERNASKNADVSKDPLASSKSRELKAILGGGFTIDTAGKQRAKRLYSSGSLADVHKWLDGCVSLLQGSVEVKLGLDVGQVVLQRVGRGGANVCVKVAAERATFDLADFVLALRAAAKDFLPFVGRCIVTLKNGVKQFQQEGEAESYMEREAAVKAVLKHQSLDRALKSLKHLLEVGAVPNSNLPQLFAKKRAEKMRSQSQAFIEYDNMWDFVTSNLPADYEKAKEEAVRLNENAVVEREQARARAEEARAKAIEERKAKELSAKAKKEDKGEDKAEEKAPKKDKKVEVKKVDKDGFISFETRTVKPDGSSVQAAPEPVPEPEPEQKGKGKGKQQQGKGKENKQQGKQQQQQGKKEEQKPAAKSAAPKPVEDASAEYLDTNPYAAALREGSFQSQADAQFKRNMEKAVVKPNQQKGKQQPQQKKQQAAQPAQKQPQAAQAKPAQKPAQQKKPAKEQSKQKETKKAMKATTAAAQPEWITPAVIGAGVLVTVALAYTFLIGA